MILTRILTALVMFAAVVGALYVSPQAFEALMAVCFALVIYEWLGIAKVGTGNRIAIPVAVAGCLLAIVALDIEIPDKVLLVLGLAATAFWSALVGIVILARKTGFAVSSRLSLTLCLLFPVTAWVALHQLMRIGGWKLMLSVFMIVWLADIFAFFSGVMFGRNRMAPAISPKKSWEGVAGAIVCVFGAAALAWFFLPHEVVFTSLVFGKVGVLAGLLILFCLVVVSIVGDLFESQLKRNAGVKDSGHLLPGHGGFFDRLDAALAVFPVALTVLMIL